MVRVMLSCAFAVLAACTVMAAELPATLVDPYVRVQEALAGDTVDGVKQDAAQIVKASAALGAPAAKLHEAAQRLERAGDVKAAREAFGRVSDALFAYAKATGATNPADVKTAFCPMANKAWLQRGDTIKNPYYGSEMLECGEWKQ